MNTDTLRQVASRTADRLIINNAAKFAFDFAMAAIATGFLLTLVGQAIGGEWNIHVWIPTWMTEVQAVVLISGFYFVGSALVGIHLSERLGRGRITGIGAATIANMGSFLVYGWIQLRDGVRVDMWQAFRFDDEYRLMVVVILTFVLVFLAVMHSVAATIFSLVHEA